MTREQLPLQLLCEPDRPARVDGPAFLSLASSEPAPAEAHSWMGEGSARGDLPFAWCCQGSRTEGAGLLVARSLAHPKPLEAERAYFRTGSKTYPTP